MEKKNITKELISAIKNTLNTVSVQGAENMRKLLMCIDTLDDIAGSMPEDPKKTEIKEDEEDG